jgi:hypothetical protein
MRFPDGFYGEIGCSAVRGEGDLGTGDFGSWSAIIIDAALEREIRLTAAQLRASSCSKLRGTPKGTNMRRQRGGQLAVREVWKPPIA